MARDLFIDLTNRRLAASETNLAPLGSVSFVKGDNGPFNLYFLEATGIINQPFVVVDKSSATVKLGIGSRTGTPSSGTYSLTFDGYTTGALQASATSGDIANALNALTSVVSAGGVTVSGSVDNHFTVRFTSAGTRGAITADVTQLIPDTEAIIDERIAGTASVPEVQELQLKLTPAVFQDTWTDLSTTVTATLVTTVTGSSLTNEVQRLSFSQEPFEGTFRITVPTYSVSVITDVVSGLFTTSDNHGLTLNQPVTLTGFSALTGFTQGTNYFVKTVPQPTQFTLATTAGGTGLTGTATITAGSVATTILRQTAPIDADANTTDLQAALEALDSIGTGNVSVSGILGQYFDIAFGGYKGYTDLPTMTVQNGTTAKPGKTADVNFSTFALRDLLENNSSVDLDLEIELVESGTRSTVIQSGCSVSEELIDSQAFSPAYNAPQTLAVLGADVTSITNSSTMQAVTGMTLSVVTGAQYWLESFLILNQNVGSATGMKFGFSGISASDVYAFSQWLRVAPGVPSQADFETALSPAISYTPSVNDTLRGIDFNMAFVANSGGTLQLEFAQVTAGASDPITLRKGTSLRLTKMS